MASKSTVAASEHITLVRNRAQLLHGSADTMAHPVFDQKRRRNMSTVILISFETLATWFGEPGLEEEYKCKNSVRSNPPPATWVFQLKGRIRMHVLDEVHLFPRNLTATYYATSWVQAPKMRFFSGTPMPRGLTDMSSYLGLLEYPVVDSNKIFA